VASNQLYQVLALTSIGSVAGLIGGVVFLFKKDWARALCRCAIPFAAGVLISISLLHLLPEAVHTLKNNAFVVLVISFVSSFVFEQYFASLHHHEDRKRTTLKSSVPLVIFGDTIHNFIDGVTIAAAYLTDPSFGLIVALASFLHETPHEIGDFGILMSAGWSRQRTFVANFLSALATFPGAIFVLLFANNTHDAHEKISLLLAISAGIFLYLGASDFLPEIGEDGKSSTRIKEVLLFIFGIAVMYGLTFLAPEH
jgi:zinc and cadmium transporter